MKKRPFNQFIAATTLLMAATIFACVTGGPKSAVASPTTDLVAKGKTLTTSFTCAGCHGPDLKGKMGPSLASSGALKKYTKATFERAMNLGIDAMGKPLPGSAGDIFIHSNGSRVRKPHDVTFLPQDCRAYRLILSGIAVYITESADLRMTVRVAFGRIRVVVTKWNRSVKGIQK